MKYSPLLSLLILLACSSSSDKDNRKTAPFLLNTEGIANSGEYLASPFVTAGDRLYMVGHQDGSFLDLGWHITGEMGGIWSHPIKLMDGFSVNLSDENGLNWCLTDAIQFVNYPIGNKHIFIKDDLEVERLQFVPEGLEGVVIQFKVTNSSKENKPLILTFTAKTDLSPTWLSDRLGVENGQDRPLLIDDRVLGAKDSLNDWFVYFGSDRGGFYLSDLSCPFQRNGEGLDISRSYKLNIAAESSEFIPIFIAGSDQSSEKALYTFNVLSNNSDSLFESKKLKYDRIKETNDLNLADEDFSQMFRWVKYNTQWLVRDVPSVGRGVSAGIPDYPWWFGTDGAYIIQGMASAGMHEEMMNLIDLIIKLSRKENGNGRIVHETSSNGVVFNPGNLNTTPTFIYALWKAYEWTGDQRILDYYEDVKKGIEWIEGQDKDKNGYPDGAGMMEIHGLDSEMIDVVSYLYQAYLAATNFAEVMSDIALAKTYQSKAALLKDRINSEWWVKNSESFADFRSNYEKFMETLSGTKTRLDTLDGLSKEIKEKVNTELKKHTGLKSEISNPDELKPWVVQSNWVVNTPMEVGAADSDKAQLALETAKNYRSRFGMYVTGVDKKEEQEQATKWKAFSYVSAVMTLPTGVQAIGEARYGNVNESLNYLKMLQNSFSYALPGSMYEVSPDFGMIAQGWNIYAVAVPVVDHFFGIQPEAQNKRITINPNLPDSWPTGNLQNIKIGDNSISITFERTEGQLNMTIEQSGDWEIIYINSNGEKVISRDQTLRGKD